MRVYTTCPKCGGEITYVARGGLIIPNDPIRCPNGCKISKLLRKQRRSEKVRCAAAQQGMPEAEYRTMRRRAAAWKRSKFAQEAHRPPEPRVWIYPATLVCLPGSAVNAGSRVVIINPRKRGR